MTVVIDNYDSFTYNLVQYAGELAGEDPVVFRNDAVTVDELVEVNPERIIISPGPRDPHDVGVTNEVISHFASSTPILGVCLWPSVYRVH